MSHLAALQPLPGGSAHSPVAHRIPRVPDADVAAPVSQAKVIRSEWLKFRTLRSTLAVLGAAVVGMLVLSAVIGYNTRHATGIAPEDSAPSGVLQGYFLGQLLIGSLGVLFVTGEYSTGMIRSTLAAVPRRLPVLRAKVVVFALVVATAMIAASVGAFLIGQAVLSQYRPAHSLSDAGALRVVIGTGVYLTLIGLLGSALGWIIRSTPGALVTVVGLLLVIPVLLGNLLGAWGRHVAEYLPSVAGGSWAQSLRGPDSLAPWTGLAVLATWVVAGLLIAAVQLRRRDA